MVFVVVCIILVLGHLLLFASICKSTAVLLVLLCSMPAAKEKVITIRHCVALWPAVVASSRAFLTLALRSGRRLGNHTPHFLL